MVREKRKQKKSEENKKSNNKESKHKIKRIKIFLSFFLNRNKEIETKETRYFSKTLKKRTSCMKKQINSKNDKNQENKGFFQKELFFATFVQQQKDIFFYETLQED